MFFCLVLWLFLSCSFCHLLCCESAHSLGLHFVLFSLPVLSFVLFSHALFCSTGQVLWDPADRSPSSLSSSGVFTVIDSATQKAIFTYTYLPQTVRGPAVNQVDDDDDDGEAAKEKAVFAYTYLPQTVSGPAVNQVKYNCSRRRQRW